MSNIDKKCIFSPQMRKSLPMVIVKEFYSRHEKPNISPFKIQLPV